MQWSPTRREFLRVAGAGSLAPASVGDVSWGNVTDDPFAPEVETRWSLDLGDSAVFPAEPVDDTFYVRTPGTIYAISTDGTRRWRRELGLKHPSVVVGPKSEPPGASRTVYVSNDSDRIYALDHDEGEVRWRYDLEESLVSSPRVHDGSVYFGTDSGTFGAISVPGSSLASDAYRTATSPAGLAVSGLLGGALAVGAYRRRNRDETAADPPELATFEDFELVEPVAETEVAEVHEARTPGGERVALKRLTTDELSDDRFAEAIRTWADLDYEGVLEVREWGTDPVPWVVTEYADATLADRVADSTTEEMAHAVADVAETVHRAHREGVTRGRLTPENVVFVGDAVRVGGWRLAAELHGPPEDDERPEDDPSPEANARQLAAMTGELLTDERVEEDLSEVLSRALADDPADRYESALKFADALRWAVRE